MIRRLAIVVSAMVFLLACEESPPIDMSPDSTLRPRSLPIEFVGLSVSRPVASEADFLAVVGPLFGSEARAGTFHTGFEIDRGLTLTTTSDPRTEEQAIVTMQMAPTDGSEPRTILSVPVSFAYGQIFVETVRVALARTQEVVATDPGGMKDWHLEYQVISANGGYLMIQLDYRDGEANVVLTTENPRTSLLAGRINTAAFTGNPHELVGGTVNFELSRDEFDFFSSRAYGVSAAADQNFDDFRLQPYDWLRITVTPQIEDGVVDVAFDVVLLDGTRVPFARAPASYVAGEQFRQNVFRLVDNMNAAELASPGSSHGFTVPFHYDDPAGGGVVRVIARGDHGVFSIAYAVDSPLHELRDVDYVPYAGDPLRGGPPPPPPSTTCEDLGSVPSDTGHLVLRFDASRTVRDSMNLTDPLRGDVHGSVFNAADVTIGGPRDGAVAVASFTFTDVDITGGVSSESYRVDAELPAGDYQVLGFMDIDGNTGATGDPDVGDPVTLPIGAIELECAEQPAVVELALLLPEGV
jgi:hypothetical protein